MEFQSNSGPVPVDHEGSSWRRRERVLDLVSKLAPAHLRNSV
jgi:hypothetical protein